MTDLQTRTDTLPTELQRALPGSAYHSPAVFERERERLFFREWFCVGRWEALHAPGDFLRADIAGERILVVRTRNGGLRGFYDVCRHRGSRLVLETEPAFDVGYCAPMEDLSLDIRRYVAERLGDGGTQPA